MSLPGPSNAEVVVQLTFIGELAHIRIVGTRLKFPLDGHTENVGSGKYVPTSTRLDRNGPICVTKLHLAIQRQK